SRRSNGARCILADRSLRTCAMGPKTSGLVRVERAPVAAMVGAGARDASRLRKCGVLALHDVAIPVPEVGDTGEVAAKVARRVVDQISWAEVVAPGITGIRARWLRRDGRFGRNGGGCLRENWRRLCRGAGAWDAGRGRYACCRRGIAADDDLLRC